MATSSDSILKKTQRGLSILAFETTKQSRILKKRMRVAALQKEIKADLRDLGNLVYNAITNHQSGILEEEEVKILVQNIRNNKLEVERQRDSISRLGRAKKHFLEEEAEEEIYGGPVPDEPPLVTVEPARSTSDARSDVPLTTREDFEGAIVQTPIEIEPKRFPREPDGGGGIGEEPKRSR
jgi:hypothetical protein